jgi:hypothetical protein
MKITDKNSIEQTKTTDALNFILENAFKSGFGTLSKTELDLILFTAILKYSNQKDISDHALSKYLQITQAKVRNLKEKASVKYITISSDEAIKKFLEKLTNAKIEDKYIDIPVYDIAVKNEIEALMDAHNILLHSQLNPKIFRLRIDDYLEFALMLELENDSELKEDKLIEKILDSVKAMIEKNEQYRKNLGLDEDSLKNLSKKTLKESLLKGGFSFGIDLLASIIPGGSFVSESAKKLLNSISKKL